MSLRCGYCNGEGQVLAYDGRPLAVGYVAGMRRLDYLWSDRRGCAILVSKFPGSTPAWCSKAMHVIFHSDFTSMSCPGCT